MHKKLMLVAAMTVVLGSRVMAHEGENHDEPKTEQQGENPGHKEHASKDLKAHGHKDHKKGAEHGDEAKGAKAKKTQKKKGKTVKAEEPKTEMPAGMPMK